MINKFDFNPFQKEIIEILSSKFPKSFDSYDRISLSVLKDWFDISRTDYGIDVSSETGKNLFIEIMIPNIENLERKKGDNVGRKYICGLSNAILSGHIPDYFKNLTNLPRYFISKSELGSFVDAGLQIKRIQDTEKGRDYMSISDSIIEDIKQISNLLEQNKLEKARNYLRKYNEQQFQLTDYELLLIRSVHFQTRKLFFMKQTFPDLSSKEFDEKYSSWNQQIKNIISFLQEKQNIENKLEKKVLLGKILLKRKLKKLNRHFLEFPEFVPE